MPYTLSANWFKLGPSRACNNSWCFQHWFFYFFVYSDLTLQCTQVRITFSVRFLNTVLRSTIILDDISKVPVMVFQKNQFLVIWGIFRGLQNFVTSEAPGGLTAGVDTHLPWRSGERCIQVLLRLSVWFYVRML